MNKKTFTTKRKAFSLIELAIVLIIIGLLIAGVTGGSALIKNAQLRSVMTEARGYQTAVNGFFERFQALPGDFNKALGTMNGAVPATTFGNLNGQIQHYADHLTLTTVTGRMEGNIALQHLQNSGFLNGITVTPATGSAATGGASAMVVLTPGVNIPASKISNAGWVFDYISAPVLTAQGNVVILTGQIAAQNGVAGTGAQNVLPTGALIPNDALSIDTKIDDGFANSGEVRSAGDSGGNASVITDGLGLTACNATTTYKTAATTAVCALAFTVDITN
jgi:prepilin-type N-terminal cleavage/methylation domain-containing protein